MVGRVDVRAFGDVVENGAEHVRVDIRDECVAHTADEVDEVPNGEGI